jgi:hypothetical protein
VAGLAGALNAPTSIDAIAWALAARGTDGAVCRLPGPNGVSVDVAVRSVMPAITRVVSPDEDIAVDDAGAGDAPDRERATPQPVAALVVDGIASVTALDGAYTERGPAGLVDEGEQPYAVVLADAERGELVIARNGAGPSLYYARLDDGWVVASEPGALVHAGVEPEPDVAVIRRFIQTGTCDESERTFFARVRRVLPGEAVVLGTAVSGPVRHPLRVRASVAVPPDEVVWRSGAGERVGVLMTPDVGGAAVLGAALHQPSRRSPLHVFTATIDGVDDVSHAAPAVLAALPRDEVHHTALAASLDLSTLDRFLLDLGEPVPDLGILRLWTVARDLSGDVEVLVDATAGPLDAWERIAERMLAHYGVAVRAPLRGAAPDEQLLTSVVRRALPPHVAGPALAEVGRTATSTQVVLRLRDEVAAALVPPRPWSDAAATVTALRRLQAGERADADALLRAFLVERWLAALGAAAAVPEAAEVRPISELPAVTPREPDEVVIGGDMWRRTPVRTAPIASGDQLLANAAFYIANALARDDGPTGPWFAVISGKAVAVSQQRVSPVLGVRPGRAARVLAFIARRRWPYLSDPRAMQVAMDHSGVFRMAGAILFGGVMPAQASVYPPRVGAMSPADAAVIEAPFQPEEVAASLVAAMRLALPSDQWRRLAGVAVASVDDAGCRVLGFAPGPASDAAPRPRTLLSLVLADNPAGQGAQRTPIIIVAQQTPAPVERALHNVDRHADLANARVR